MLGEIITYVIFNRQTVRASATPAKRGVA